MSSIIAVFLSACMVAAAQQSTRPYPPQLDGARVEVYKTVGDVKLNLYVFEPDGHQTTDKRAAIVFFFGGGWRAGSPQQFQHHCRYFASRGMVAITADYRVSSRHQTKVPDSVRDANSAIRWVRQNASHLGIDPSRIAAAGGSAGGHLAASAAILPDLREPNEDAKISSRPDALALLNPALLLAEIPDQRFEGTVGSMAAFAGVDRAAVSPYHHISEGAPPTIIFHGKADTTVPYITAEMFAKKMVANGNRCDLVGFEGETHGFFNYGRGEDKAYYETLRRTDEFLTALGYLKGEPTLP